MNDSLPPPSAHYRNLMRLYKEIEKDIPPEDILYLR